MNERDTGVRQKVSINLGVKGVDVCILLTIQQTLMTPVEILEPERKQIDK